MNTKRQIDLLWKQLRDAINTAYADANKRQDDDGMCLRDYAEDISWSDDLIKLLSAETANEKQHRSGRTIRNFSAATAAKLIILDNVADGSQKPEMPKPTLFLVCRKTAAESIVIGWLLRNTLTDQFRAQVKSLDYAALMQDGGN